MRPVDAEELHNTLFRVGGEISLNAFLVFEKLILDAPTISPVKHGKWFIDADFNSFTFGHYKCSECGEWHHDKYNYCPDCGAKMK